jgi:hypothetical protein
LGGAGISVAQPDPKFEPRYEALYAAAKTNWSAQATVVSNAWLFARATFDLAEFATNDARRAQLAVEGIDAARSALRAEEACAPAHYYLAMNLGQLARTKLLGALKLVSEMETHFVRAAALDPKFDFAGPDRNLGILYREAPGWPASIGSRSKARTHLKKAAELAPAYPANQLELLQAYLDWHEQRAAARLVPQVTNSLSAAKAEFQGESWAWAWDDWNRMWEVLHERFKAPSR